MSYDDEWTGNFLPGHRCPKCNCALLHNKLGYVWCSFVQCDFGLNGNDVKLIDDNLVEVKSCRN